MNRMDFLLYREEQDSGAILLPLTGREMIWI
jgi:hypothetical protein